MSQLVSALKSSGHPSTFLRSLLVARPNPNKISKKTAVFRLKRGILRLECSKPTERSTDSSSKEVSEGESPSILLRPWDVPWDWRVTSCVMIPYIMSIIFTGIANSVGLGGQLQPHFEDTLTQLHTTDELAMRLFIDQLLKSMAKLLILYVFVRPHQPFPDDIFSIRWERPFNPQQGWILWAGGGLIIASVALLFVKSFISGSNEGQTQNEAELVRLLPLIGSSNVSTACLLGILGIIAPICEETIYRGFLLTSLTKWFPLPVSVILSSAVFALAHQSPGIFLEIFIYGIILGLIYAQTRNLLAPIVMHACWNSGVILFLTYLHSQGHDIQKYLL